MTSPDIARLHQRIDELVEKIGELSSAVAKSLAACESCRPFVLGGNGKPALGDRLGEVQQEINEVRQTLSERIAEVSMEVVVLKSVREIGSRVFWSAIGAGRHDLRRGGGHRVDVVARRRPLRGPFPRWQFPANRLP